MNDKKEKTQTKNYVYDTYTRQAFNNMKDFFKVLQEKDKPIKF